MIGATFLQPPSCNLRNIFLSIGGELVISTRLENQRMLLLRSRGVRAATASTAATAVCGRRASALLVTQTRSQSILGAIFGIGEFEGARNQSLRATTSKLQAYELALLEVERCAQAVLHGVCVYGECDVAVSLMTVLLTLAVCRHERVSEAHAAQGDGRTDRMLLDELNALRTDRLLTIELCA